MEQIEINEQWKLEGDCRKCRKNNYCKKACKAYRQDMERIAFKAIDRRMDGLFTVINEVYKKGW